MKATSFTSIPTPEPVDTSQALPAEEVCWELILEEEPEVAEVFAELYKGKPGGYRPWRHYVARHGTTPKAHLCKLVGWHARNPRLRSQAAYELTMRRMWELVL